MVWCVADRLLLGECGGPYSTSFFLLSIRDVRGQIVIWLLSRSKSEFPPYTSASVREHWLSGVAGLLDFLIVSFSFLFGSRYA